MLFLFQSAVVFIAVAAADFAWTKYMLHVAAKRPHLSGIWSAAIIGLGAVSVYSYTHNPWLILPAMLGAYCGTWLAVTRELTKPPTECEEGTVVGASKYQPPTYPPIVSLVVRAPCLWHGKVDCADCNARYTPHLKPPCDHRKCTVSESDGDLLRWSCGRIEG